MFLFFYFFFFNDTATTEIYTTRHTLSLHDALPILARPQTVFIRARKPCLLMRRRLRGRYVGPINSSSKAGKVTRLVTRRSRLTFPQRARSFAPPLLDTLPF